MSTTTTALRSRYGRDTNLADDFFNGEGFRQAEAAKTVDRIAERATITAGVIRWNSNDRVPPLDIVALAAEVFEAVDFDASREAYEADAKRSISEYRRRRAQRTPEQVAEERAEMRAAFGPGATVVDVLTGERTAL